MSKPAFAVVVERHGPTVLRVCRAVVGPDDADDAWSETFLSALRAYPELPEDANHEAWLVRIAHHRSVDLLRRRGRAPRPVAALPDRPSPHGNPRPPEDALWAAVAALPERQRLAVAYHYLGGLPHAEVAALIGGRTDAVRRAAADGIAALRRAYPEDDG
ncbi:RNA polymerase sigma factor (sigma-70 family) [Friedmanniella endophytica]|uniref:RNA polymerase sigma factor (Sigma-70 family) n=1 Tax=Microlunatus kandeliicorticis TaxID=1759536 RepID=A0A7W3IQS6_9ACTN|nr:sigma-70 family RNA polymerase sigma factor [Microlunatus kandeliicorticis]MBA8793505.1 RNA polymerase sigma factor (sigma-70 family) [Microlunatus kandeliicorticis]